MIEKRVIWFKHGLVYLGTTMALHAFWTCEEGDPREYFNQHIMPALRKMKNVDTDSILNEGITDG